MGTEIRFSLQQLMGGIKIRAASGLMTPVTGVHYDSRQVQPGFVFVCISGYRADGHSYIDDAARRGAAAVVIETEAALPAGLAWARVPDTRSALADMAANFYGHPSREMSLFGVTGTNGKTTTVHLIASLLRAGGMPMAEVGTVWNQRTTPESLDLQRSLRCWADQGIRGVAMEASSHGLFLKRVAGCEFDAAVFTNVSQDHLDFHGDLKEYLAVKMRLFQHLGQDRTKARPCYAVVNLDDPHGREVCRATAAPILTYGIDEEAEVRAVDLRLSEHGTAFTVCFEGNRLPFKISLPGRFNVYNSLAAIAVGLKEGLQPDLIERVLAGAAGVPGRFQVVNEGQDFTVVVDYAHTPDGLENVLRTARALTRGRADRRVWLRRRPRPGQAADDGQDSRAAMRCCHYDL